MGILPLQLFIKYIRLFKAYCLVQWDHGKYFLLLFIHKISKKCFMYSFKSENNETDILKFQTSISIVFCITYDNIILTA